MLYGDIGIISRVWTCFEHCMVKSPDILRDRHMDQIIMCSIYILSKVMGVVHEVLEVGGSFCVFYFRRHSIWT